MTKQRELESSRRRATPDARRQDPRVADRWALERFGPVVIRGGRTAAALLPAAAPTAERPADERATDVAEFLASSSHTPVATGGWNDLACAVEAPTDERVHSTALRARELLARIGVTHDVQLFLRSPAAVGAGRPAHAQGREVHLRDAEAPSRVLAHEVVHVAQTEARYRAPHPAYVEVEAAALASRLESGAQVARPHFFGEGRLGFEEGEGHEDEILSHPIAMELSVSMMGLDFHPADPEAAYAPGLHRGLQFLTAALARIAVTSSPALAREAAAWLASRDVEFTIPYGSAATQDGTRVEPIRIETPHALALIEFLRDEKGIALRITAEQVGLLEAGQSAAEMWRALQAAGDLPGWFTEPLFFVLAARNESLLRRHTQAADGDAGQAMRDDAVSRMRVAIQPYLDTVEAIRTDAALVPEPAYRGLFRLPALTEGTEAPPPERTSVRTELVVMLIQTIGANPALGRAARAEGPDGTDARRRLLRALATLAEHADLGALAQGDQQLSDAPAQSNAPAAPARLRAYPEIGPPTWDLVGSTGADAERAFEMSVLYDDNLEAIGAWLNTNYHWEVIRVDEAALAAARGTGSELDQRAGQMAHVGEVASDPTVRGDAPTWGDRLGQRLSRHVDYAAEDLARVNAVDTLIGRLGAPGVAADALIVGSRIFAGLGTIVSSFFEEISRPKCETSVPFEEPGLYIVRCTVTRRTTREQATWMRAPSMAWLPVWVKTPEEMSTRLSHEDSGSEPEARAALADVEAQLADPNLSEEDREQLEYQMRQLWAPLDGSSEDVLLAERDRLRLRLEQLESEPDAGAEQRAVERRLAEIEETLDTYNQRIADRGESPEGAEPYFRPHALLVTDSGHPVRLLIELLPEPTEEGQHRFYVTDATSRDGGHHTGPARPDRTDAVEAAVREYLEQPDRYGRGFVTLRIPPRWGSREAPVERTFRVAANGTAILLESVENTVSGLSTLALAAAPFAPQALVFLAPLGVIGAVPSGYRLISRADAGTLRLDFAAAMDMVNVLGGVTGLASMAAGNATRVGRMVLVFGAVQDATVIGLAGGAMLEQLDLIDKNAPPGVQRAMAMQIVGTALLTTGMVVGGRLISAARELRLRADAEGSAVAHERADADLHATIRTASGQDIAVFRDESLAGNTVEVRYRVDGYGLVHDIHLKIGPTATAADVQVHGATVRTMASFGGIRGRIRNLADRLTRWLTGNPRVRPGSRAWEARLEVEKLPRVMRELDGRIARGEVDAQAAEAHRSALEKQLADNEAALTDMEAGRGFVAAQAGNDGRAVEAGYPPPPPEHHYVELADGTFQLERHVGSTLPRQQVVRQGGVIRLSGDAAPVAAETPSRLAESEEAGRAGSRSHGQFGVDEAAGRAGGDPLVAPERFMDSRYLVDTLFDGDVAAARSTLRERYTGDNATIRRLLTAEAVTPDQVALLLDGGDGVSAREAADLRRSLVEARLTRIEPRLRAAALAHSGVEVHNHFKGVLDPDYFIKRLYGDDSDASYLKALDWLRGRYSEVGEDGQLTVNARELRAGSPEVLSVLEGGYSVAEARQVFHRIMQASEHMPFDSTYDPRGELLKRIVREVPNGAEVVLRDTLARLRADGITYAELQLDPNKIGVTPERFREISREVGVQVELLTHLISERTLGGDTVVTEAQLEARLRTQTGEALPRDMLAGFDVAGREVASFTEQGMQTFENAYVVLARAAGREGQPYVLRPHVGEGYSSSADGRRDGVARDGAEARVAQHNIQAVIDRVQAMRARGVYVPPAEGGKVIIRLGHVTHATEAQARAMHDLGLIAEVNIGSNIATGALPRPRPGHTRLSEHPLLLLLYHGVDVLQSTDAQGVMSTNMVTEFALAERIIRDFKAGKTKLEIDGRTLDWSELSHAERSVLGRRLSVGRIREASLRYQERISTRFPVEGQSP